MKKVSAKCEATELEERRFFEFIKHQTELWNLKTELRNLYAEQEAREQRRKAQKIARARKMRRERKWAETWFCAGLTVFSAFLYSAQIAGLIAPVLSIPAMVICFGLAVWFLSDIAHICKEERMDRKGRFTR